MIFPNVILSEGSESKDLKKIFRLRRCAASLKMTDFRSFQSIAEGDSKIPS